jgi:hypothetical protein
MDQIQEEFQESKRDSEAMRAFGVRLYNQYSANKAYRRPKELQWLEDLRAYKGLYDPSVRIDPDNSHVYPKLTRSKVNIVLSRLHEMLFPDQDRNWELSPTPEPVIQAAIVFQIAQQITQPPPIDPQTGQVQIDPQTGYPMQPIPPTREQLNEAIKDFAKQTAMKMQSEIDDQLTEMDYPELAKKVLRSGLQYGTGILAGPLVSKRQKRRWQPDEQTNTYTEKIEDQDVPYMEFTRIWDWYPDMSVDDAAQAQGFYQRAILTKHDLRKLMKRPDFDKAIIRQILQERPDGDYVPEPFEVDLQAIEVEAGMQGASETQTAVLASDSTTTRSSYRQTGKRYEAIQYWGYVDGSDLAACGVLNPDGSEIDVDLEYAVNIWLINKQPVKVMLFDGALDHYKIFYYEKDETSIFGEGLARVMRHSQIAVSSAARMMLDNGACVSGPQVEVNWQLMHEGTDLNSFYPRKIWYRDGRGIEAQWPAIRVYNIDSHIEELKMISDVFMDFADKETCLPTWMIGDKVNNENSKQTSGRQSEILVSIKDVVKNFDTFTERVMRDLYSWNMEFNPREDIKGDFQCKPRGVSSLVIKEIRMAALANLKNTMQPEDWPYIPRREFLDETFKAHDIKINLRTEEQAQEIISKQTDQRAQELAYAQMEAEVAYKRAQTAGQLTKAKKFNVEAEKDAITPPDAPPAADPRLQDAELMAKSTDIAAKNEQIRRDEEAHQQKLRQEAENHQLNREKTVLETAHAEDLKERDAQHKMELQKKDMEIKEKQVKAQKSVKKPAKPKSKGI